MAGRKRKIKKPSIRKVSGSIGGRAGGTGGAVKAPKVKGGGTYKGGLPKTKESYDKLVKDLRNARARIRAAEKRYGKDNYYGPDANDYTLDRIKQRLESGEHINRIYAELRNYNAEGLKRINYENTVVATGGTGWAITRKDALESQKAIDKANSVLAAARKNHPDAQIPADYTIQGIADLVETPEGLKQYTNILKKAYARPDAGELAEFKGSGEYMLQGERSVLDGFFDAENARRAENRKFQQTVKARHGRFLTQPEFATTELNPDWYQHADTYRRIPYIFNEAKTARTAENWKLNYMTSLETVQFNSNAYAATARDSMYDKALVDKLLEEIRQYVLRLDTADMVTKATLYTADFNITEANYFPADEAVARLNQIVTSWENFFEYYGEYMGR